MMRIEWGDQATRDLEDVADYYAEYDPSLPDTMIERVYAAALPLIDNPRLGPLLNDAGVRKWRIRRTPYLMFYDVRGDLIRVLRVIHAATDWTRYV